MKAYDARACALGEGPLWHPLRGELFWFDILEKRLMTATQEWQFDEYVSAAGWIDAETLLMASASGLWRLSLESGAREKVAALEAENSLTRSNDGRADPCGGFWIGTMGIDPKPGQGAIYRYFRGELRKLHPGITVSNAIAFSPDGLWAYFADSAERRIMRQALSDTDGWPVAEPEVFIDLRDEGLTPDGAVVDSDGNLWNAQWGAGRVACYADGALRHVENVPARHTSCPAFGGADLQTLFCTSSADGLDGPAEGLTYMAEVGVTGQREHQVIL